MRKVKTTRKYNNAAYVKNNMLSIRNLDLTSKDLSNVGRRYEGRGIYLKHSAAQAINEFFAKEKSKIVGAADGYRFDYEEVNADGQIRLAIIPNKDGKNKIRVISHGNDRCKYPCLDYYFTVRGERELLDKHLPIPEGGHCCHFGMKHFKGGLVLIPVEYPVK